MNNKKIRVIHKALREGGYVRGRSGKNAYDSFLWHEGEGMTIDVIGAKNMSVGRRDEIVVRMKVVLAKAGIAMENMLCFQHYIYIHLSEGVER